MALGRGTLQRVRDAIVSFVVGLALAMIAARPVYANDDESPFVVGAELALRLPVSGFSAQPLFPQAALVLDYEPVAALRLLARGAAAAALPYGFFVLDLGVGFAPRFSVLQPYVSLGPSGGVFAGRAFVTASWTPSRQSWPSAYRLAIALCCSASGTRAIAAAAV